MLLVGKDGHETETEGLLWAKWFNGLCAKCLKGLVYPMMEGLYVPNVQLPAVGLDFR